MKMCTCQKQIFKGPYKLKDRLRQNLTKRKININSILNENVRNFQKLNISI